MEQQNQSPFDANESISSSPQPYGRIQGTFSPKPTSGRRRQLQQQQQQGKLQKIRRMMPPIYWWILLSIVAVAIRQFSKSYHTYLTSLCLQLEEEDDGNHDHHVDVMTTAFLPNKPKNNVKKHLPKAAGKRKQSSSTQNSPTIPSIAFLFLIDDQRLDERMWKSWFDKASDRRMYSIFVHGNHQERPRINTMTNITTTTTTRSLIDHRVTVTTKTEIINSHPGPVDQTILPLGPFFCPHAVSTVPSEWFWLYDVQIHLLAEAYKNDPAATHFIYVSDTSVPLMSFNDMYEHLLHHPTSIVQRHRKRTKKIRDNTNNQKPVYRSRFCYFNKERTDHAWFHPRDKLKLPQNTVRKAELWSILARSHVALLLKQRATLNHWNQVFYNMSMIHGKGGVDGVGAPDENLFPTLLQLSVPPTEMIQNCTKGQNFVKGCCSTMTSWQHHGSTVYTNEYDKSSTTFLSDEEKQSLMKQLKKTNYTNKNMVKLSDTCSDRRPCQFYDYLYEDGLIRLQQLGFFFLRKIPYTRPIIIRNSTTTSFMPEERMMIDSGDGTAKIPAKVARTIITETVTTKIIRNHVKVKTAQGQFVPLQLALPQIHQHRPIGMIKQKEVDDNRKFICYAPPPAVIASTTTSTISGVSSWNRKYIVNQGEDYNDEDEDIKYMNNVDDGFIKKSSIW